MKLLLLYLIIVNMSIYFFIYILFLIIYIFFLNEITIIVFNYCKYVNIFFYLHFV